MRWKERVFFAIKRLNGTITKLNNEIVSIVEIFCNDLHKCENQRKSNLIDPRKNITKPEEIISVMTEEVFEVTRCMRL